MLMMLIQAKKKTIMPLIVVHFERKSVKTKAR